MPSTRSLLRSASVLYLVFFLGTCALTPSLQPASVSSRMWNFSSEVNNILASRTDPKLPENWDAAISNGKRLYNAWKVHTDYYDRLLRGGFRPQSEHKILLGRLTPPQAELLRDQGKPTEASEYYGIDMWYPRDRMEGGRRLKSGDLVPPERLPDGVWSRCEINVWYGVILVQGWYRGPEVPSDYSDGDILWLMSHMWTPLKFQDRPPGLKIHPGSPVKLDPLENIIFDPVTDADTKTLMMYIRHKMSTESKWLGMMRLWAPEDMGPDHHDFPGNDNFWALLGSPPGQIVQSFLTGYKGSLDAKRVGSIVVIVDGDRGEQRLPEEDTGQLKFALIFELDETEAPKPLAEPERIDSEPEQQDC